MPSKQEERTPSYITSKEGGLRGLLLRKSIDDAKYENSIKAIKSDAYREKVQVYLDLGSNDKASFLYPDNVGTYNGEWEGGVPHGIGTFYWTDGAQYSGEWKEGTPEGDGKFRYPDGEMFIRTSAHAEVIRLPSPASSPNRAERKAHEDAKGQARVFDELKRMSETGSAGSSEIKALEEYEGKEAQDLARMWAEAEARAAAEDRERKRRKEEARAAAEAEARKVEEAQARAKAEEEEQLKAEAEARAAEEERERIRREERERAAAEDEAMRLQELARKWSEAEARTAAEEQAREEEEARAAARAMERRLEEERARMKAQEEERLRADAEARAAAEEQARMHREEEAKAAAEDDAKRPEEEQAQIKAEEEKWLRADAEARASAVEQAFIRREEEDAEWKSFFSASEANTQNDEHSIESALSSHDETSSQDSEWKRFRSVAEANVQRDDHSIEGANSSSYNKISQTSSQGSGRKRIYSYVEDDSRPVSPDSAYESRRSKGAEASKELDADEWDDRASDHLNQDSSRQGHDGGALKCSHGDEASWHASADGDEKSSEEDSAVTDAAAIVALQTAVIAMAAQPNSTSLGIEDAVPEVVVEEGTAPTNLPTGQESKDSNVTLYLSAESDDVSHLSTTSKGALEASDANNDDHNEPQKQGRQEHQSPFQPIRTDGEVQPSYESDDISHPSSGMFSLDPHGDTYDIRKSFRTLHMQGISEYISYRHQNDDDEWAVVGAESETIRRADKNEVDGAKVIRRDKDDDKISKLGDEDTEETSSRLLEEYEERRRQSSGLHNNLSVRDLPRKKPTVIAWKRLGFCLVASVVFVLVFLAIYLTRPDTPNPESYPADETPQPASSDKTDVIPDAIEDEIPAPTQSPTSDSLGSPPIVPMAENLTFPPTTSEPAPTKATSWTQLGAPLIGENGDLAGFAVAMSRDGTRAATGARHNSEEGVKNRGSVRIFKRSDASGVAAWVQIAKIYGAGTGDQFGYALSFSGDGKILAIGAPGHDLNGKNSGQVILYEEESLGSWVAKATLNGEGRFSLFGVSVSLSSGGDILAVGAPYHCSNGLTYNGAVYVYQTNVEGSWTSLGLPTKGTSAKELFGWSVSVSSSSAASMRVAVGSPKDTSEREEGGHVSVYVYHKPLDFWDVLGERIERKVPLDRFGFSVSLSDYGDRLAIGSYGYKNRDTGVYSGLACVYENKDGENAWRQIGNDLYGLLPGFKVKFGFSVSLSPGGTQLNVGAPRTRGAMAQNAGQISVFKVTKTGVDRLGEISGEPGDNVGFSLASSIDGRYVIAGSPISGLSRVYAPVSEVERSSDEEMD